MLSLQHIQEIVSAALASVQSQQATAKATAEADQHQYAGALEGIRFLGSLLEQKHKELEGGAGDKGTGDGQAAAEGVASTQGGAASSPSTPAVASATPPAG